VSGLTTGLGTTGLATTGLVSSGVGISSTGYSGTSGLTGGLIGENNWGVPIEYPLLPADPNCSRCHGSGYKKTLVTRKWKPCKLCAAKYNIDMKAIDLKHRLNPTHGIHTHGVTTGGLQQQTYAVPSYFPQIPAN
jgi:hypothetical protein